MTTSHTRFRLFVINLASVPGRQFVNSPTAESLERYMLLYKPFINFNMDTRKKGFALVVFISFCILIISIMPFFKTLFVAESGRFEFLGQNCGWLFIIGLFAKWRNMSKVILAIYCFDLLWLTSIFFSTYNSGIGNTYAYIILILLHLIVVLLLSLSQPVRNYINDSNYNHNSINSF